MDLEQLLALQELDTRVAQLGHRLTHDPVLAGLAAAEASVVEIERRELQLFGERDTVRQELKRLEDEAALTAHFQTPHMAEFNAVIPAFVAGPPSINRYDVSKVAKLM